MFSIYKANQEPVYCMKETKTYLANLNKLTFLVKNEKSDT